MLAPLNLTDVAADPEPSLENRLVHVSDAARPGTEIEAYNSTYWRGLALPWGGLYGTARDLSKFAATFLPTGPRFLSLAAAHEMIRNQTRGLPGGIESGKVSWPVAHWGLGWEVKGSKRRHWTGDLTSPHTFCHFGQAGTLLWADPERDLAVAIFGNRTVTHLWPFVPARWARLSNAIVAAIDGLSSASVAAPRT